ncbi:GTPase domain-containing protein [Curvibacter lanceolatus]|uniref:GTPase domain-containing protein n=1 Tax=Curvibacter lanceolatus TaxID=86182 RepID=UPI002480CBCA|nr:GTPase domain-containing protein [Curvibacter lanceolatus]
MWGRPNSGKTTFISQLRGEHVQLAEKKATTSRVTYKDVKLRLAAEFVVESIVDMPGTDDRLDDWRELVAKGDHVFYLLNISRTDDAGYVAAVRTDLKATIEALNKSSKGRKRINIIASHVDQSKWNTVDVAQVNNVLQEDPVIRRMYESMEGVKGYVYSANLTDPASFKRLLQSIVDDLQA